MRILIFGASTTQGAFDEECGGWADRLKIYCFKTTSTAEKKSLVFNLGISGEKSHELLERIEPEITCRYRENETVILFSIGLNDSKVSTDSGENATSIDTYRTCLKELCTIMKRYSNKVVFVGLQAIIEEKLNPIPWNKTFAHHNSDVQKYDTVAREVVEAHGGVHIPMFDIFSDNPGRYFSSDGLHPNAEGHRLMFERVKSELERLNIL